jgi:hypothetical protein
MYTKTFSKRLHKRYKDACVKNNDKETGDFYHCATQGDVTARYLDLKQPYVFCAKRTNKEGNRQEYRAQAYMIRQAKANNWQLQIKDEEGKNVDWILLDAERNFAGKGAHKKLDLLAYSETKKAYIVLELKKDRNALPKAQVELGTYIQRMKDEVSGANIVYGKNVANDKVFGYLIAPETPSGYNKNNDAFGFGVILFDHADDQKALFVSGTPSFDIYKKDPQQG